MSKFVIRNESNYAAKAFTIKSVLPLKGLDKLVGIPVDGHMALVQVGKFHMGDTAVMFPAESQLSDQFCKDNKLYREDGGYIEKNRRVRAIKLRGHYSTALVLPAQAVGNPPPGTIFDTVNGVEVCRKYVVPSKANNATMQPKKNKTPLVDAAFFPEHTDTKQFLRFPELLDPAKFVYVTQKLHGTSVRMSRTYTNRELNWRDKLAKRLGVPVQDKELRVISGSRKVVKTGSKEKGFYDVDIWEHAAERYGHLISANVMVYGELVGYLPGTNKPIQKGYTYNLPEGEYDMYVYRVSVIASDGQQYDLDFHTMRDFCHSKGLKTPPFLNFTVDNQAIDDCSHYIDVALHEEWSDGNLFMIEEPVPLSSDSPVDEGVVLRQDGIETLNLKWKSPIFLEHETRILDEGEEIAS